MKSSRTLFAVLLSFVVLAAAILPGSIRTADGATGGYTPGTYTAAAKGFGGEVTVSVTVSDKKITAVNITGEKETHGIGSRAVENLPAAIVAANGSVDGIAGATITSRAVMEALASALKEARGETKENAGGKTSDTQGALASVSMTDGVYTASARGFSVTQLLEASVEIRNGKIANITIGDNGETVGQLKSVTERLFPRILESQSLAVDAICGATVTSNAIKNAVEDACLQAGANRTDLYTAIPVSDKTEEYTVDVAVVGMGGSGTAAALSAAQKGASVMAIDSAGKWGGTSAITSGPMAVNVPSQVEKEIPEWLDAATGEKRTKKAGENLVDADALYEDWIAYTTVDGIQQAKPQIIRDTIYKSGATLDWLSSLGFEFDNARGFLNGKWSIFTTYKGNKALTDGFFDAAYDKFTNELGGKYLLETKGTELIVESGKVAGVKAVKYDGTAVIIHAKSVVLATGGFGGNAEMTAQYMGGDPWKLYGMYQNNGGGILMATAAGAATYNINMPPMSHFVAPYMIMNAFESPADNDIPYGLVCTSEALAVDRSGNRFINETDISLEGFTGGAKFYTVYSKEQIDILREKGLSAAASGRYLSQGGVAADTPLTNIDAVLQKGIEMGFIYKADSLEKLSDAINNGNMTGEALRKTVEAYNAGANGSDKMGKAAEKFARLGAVNAKSEYYVAVTGAPYIYSSCAGLDVNESMQVLSAAGQPIEGLYAAGIDAMGVLFAEEKAYANYGGVAQGYAFYSGKVAGETAADIRR